MAGGCGSSWSGRCPAPTDGRPAARCAERTASNSSSWHWRRAVNFYLMRGGEGCSDCTERTTNATKTTTVVTTICRLSSLPDASKADAASTARSLELTTRAQATPATTNAATNEATVPLVRKNAMVLAAAAQHRVRGDACVDDLIDERRVAAPQQYVIERMKESVGIGYLQDNSSGGWEIHK
jgi:hypothetical protein